METTLAVCHSPFAEEADADGLVLVDELRRLSSADEGFASKSERVGRRWLSLAIALTAPREGVAGLGVSLVSSDDEEVEDEERKGPTTTVSPIDKLPKRKWPATTVPRSVSSSESPVASKKKAARLY